MQGWISVYREILDKPIWTTSTPEQKVVLMTIMLLVNHEENEWEFKGEKFKVKPGQMITSLPSLASKCGKDISIQNVRTSLKRFEKYGFLTDESTNKNRLITIVNYGFYQGHDINLTGKSTGDQQATNRQLTANNNDNNNNNDNKEDIIPFSDIVNYLNAQANTNYKSSTKKTKDLIKARFNEKFTLEDFKQVIDIKVNEWGSDKKMNQYLRPQTLFGTNFESYLNQKDLTKKKSSYEERNGELLF